MNRRTTMLLLLLAALACPGCTAPEPADPAGEPVPTVFVSIPPQKFLVQRIAGDLVAVEVLLPPGQSPATYEPTPQQMGRLSGASLYFRIGVPFEDRLMQKITDTVPQLEVVDTRQGITMRRMEGGGHGHAHHHGDHVHEAGAPDPHTWLSPRLAAVQARTIHGALAGLLPRDADGLQAGLDRLTADLEEADRRAAAVLEPLRGRTIYVFHPAYGYLADAYGLTQVAVESEGKEPGAKRLASIIENMRREGVTVIFYQPQFSRSSAETLARELGGSAVELDPLAEDYLENLELMASVISSALETKTD
jgi:zinc transport system substrate-binding protein